MINNNNLLNWNSDDFLGNRVVEAGDSKDLFSQNCK